MRQRLQAKHYPIFGGSCYCVMLPNIKSLLLMDATADTETIQKYLAKYINRVGISDSRVQYLKEQSQVIIQYNDYKAQQQNQAAPKALLMMEPMVFIH